MISLAVATAPMIVLAVKPTSVFILAASGDNRPYDYPSSDNRSSSFSPMIILQRWQHSGENRTYNYPSGDDRSYDYPIGPNRSYNDPSSDNRSYEYPRGVKRSYDYIGGNRSHY